MSSCGAGLLLATEIGRAARPGHSEHQLGTTIDVGTTAIGQQSLAEHAAEHGFALSLAHGAEKLTGVRCERGAALATCCASA
ncbi:MAG TPA: D-alanyl-D-alanine carboxypeptidase family protein [Polyangiaceae bacterium]|nr:D-alanyl-D-alanine carboxypeptidase family protein [Polyangiaceae bacterium]